VKKKIVRNFLEIKSITNLNEVKKLPEDFSIKFLETPDYQLNKFFYKNIGEKYEWKDRLIWTDKNWINYVTNKNLSTYILKKKDDLVGYYEIFYHVDKKEFEIIYLGILKEYFEKKLGGYLLSYAIKKSFSNGASRMWLHTCSLDHKNALKNYLSRGMKIFKSETINV
jgi:ribosomal protein S18 acetylase RimI-like enzyme|tara:strand:+ start:668 stop:1171 length:504 start_codon:yes stop_codon:yes gene_type:complete